MNPCMLHQKGGGASILHMRSMRPWLHLPHHTAHASYTPESILMLICVQVLSYNYIYSLNAWLLLNPWWLCFDWSMGCVPLLNSIGDFRLIAVAAFWIASGVLIYHCLMARNDPMKK